MFTGIITDIGTVRSVEPRGDLRLVIDTGYDMNSVAIVEHPAGARRLHYVVTIVSNVLRRNSAGVHMAIATRLQRLMESLHPPAPPSGDASR